MDDMMKRLQNLEGRLRSLEKSQGVDKYEGEEAEMGQPVQGYDDEVDSGDGEGKKKSFISMMKKSRGME